METNILLPLLLTLGAGLATGIGSAIAFFARRTNKRLLSFSLGLSGGVMIYVSFVELFQQANLSLTAEWGVRTGTAVTVASFFAGILLIGVIDRLVPSFENPHEAHMVEEMDNQPRNPHLMRMGVMTALAIGIHNFPEGIATFTSAVDNMAPRAAGARRSASRCSRDWPSRWEPCWHGWCSCPSCRRRSWAASWPAWRVSWSSSRSTNCCPRPANTAKRISRSTAW